MMLFLLFPSLSMEYFSMAFYYFLQIEIVETLAIYHFNREREKEKHRRNLMHTLSIFIFLKSIFIVSKLDRNEKDASEEKRKKETKVLQWMKHFNCNLMDATFTYSMPEILVLIKSHFHSEVEEGKGRKIWDLRAKKLISNYPKILFLLS